MPALLLDPDVIIFTDPMGGKEFAQPHRWWAERGLIHWENQVSGKYGSQTIVDTLYRLKALQDMLRNSRRRKGLATGPDDLEKYQRFIEGMLNLCQKAKYQGDPSDPEVTRQKGAEIKAARQSRHVIIPGLADCF